MNTINYNDSIVDSTKIIDNNAYNIDTNTLLVYPEKEYEMIAFPVGATNDLVADSTNRIIEASADDDVTAPYPGPPLESKAMPCCLAPVYDVAFTNITSNDYSGRERTADEYTTGCCIAYGAFNTYHTTAIKKLLQLTPQYNPLSKSQPVPMKSQPVPMKSQPVPMKSQPVQNETFNQLQQQTDQKRHQAVQKLMQQRIQQEHSIQQRIQQKQEQQMKYRQEQTRQRMKQQLLQLQEQQMRQMQEQQSINTAQIAYIQHSDRIRSADISTGMSNKVSAPVASIPVVPAITSSTNDQKNQQDQPINAPAINVPSTSMHAPIASAPATPNDESIVYYFNNYTTKQTCNLICIGFHLHNETSMSAAAISIRSSNGWNSSDIIEAYSLNNKMPQFLIH